MTIQVALVAGPMYDHLYRVFDDHDVDVVVHADHPTLNAEVTRRLGRGERLDLISTHSKYAPSQGAWLRPLGDLLAASTVEALAPGAVELCRHDGRLLCAPRLIDVRVLWARSDRVASVADTWAELIESDVVFGFTGRESGLFGLFFELVVGAGGRLFDDSNLPVIESTAAVAAVEMIVELARRAPPELSGWGYDDVADALLDGRVDAAAAWPGGWQAINSSPLSDVLRPFPYPAGPSRRVSYSGCHAWAIPHSCGDVGATLALVHELLDVPAQLVDASGGNMAANVAALAAVEPVSDIDARRIRITQETIAQSMITYPSLERFPTIEDAGWHAINAAIRGECSPADAVRRIQDVAVTPACAAERPTRWLTTRPNQ